MNPPELSAIALFCEDTREEKTGAISLMGILADNLAVPGFPGAMPRLTMYIRIHMAISFDPCEFRIFLNYASGERVLISTIEKEMVIQAIKEAESQNNKIAGIYSQSQAQPFPVPEPGRMYIDLSYRNEKVLIGALNFVQSDIDGISSTRSAA